MLKECIRSVSEQTYTTWQYLVVNDNGADDEEITDYIGAHLAKEKVTVINRCRLPQGAPTCRNIGLQAAIGQYIIFLDSDDLLAPYCLEHRVKIMEENPELDFAVFPMLVFSEHPEEAKYFWNVETSEDDLLRFLRLDTVWQTSGPIWRKSALDRIGGFTEGLHCWQDVDFHLKALSAGLKYRKYYNLPPDCYYRRHSEGSISQRRINTPVQLRDRWEVLENAYQQVTSRCNSYGKEALLLNLRIMLAGILLSSLKTHSFRFFFLRVFHPYSVEVLTYKQLILLCILSGLYYSRLQKVSFVKTFTDKIVEKRFSIETTIGKISKPNLREQFSNVHKS